MIFILLVKKINSKNNKIKIKKNKKTEKKFLGKKIY